MKYFQTNPFEVFGAQKLQFVSYVFSRNCMCLFPKEEH